MINERQSILLERLQEDEHLLGDVEDTAAAALLTWASARVQAVAADPARPDDAVAAEVQAIRQAARVAARSGEHDPQRLVALATAALEQTQSSGSIPAQPASAAQAAAHWSFFRRMRAPRGEPRFRWHRSPGKDS